MGQIVANRLCFVDGERLVGHGLSSLLSRHFPRKWLGAEVSTQSRMTGKSRNPDADSQNRGASGAGTDK